MTEDDHFILQVAARFMIENYLITFQITSRFMIKDDHNILLVAVRFMTKDGLIIL